MSESPCGLLQWTTLYESSSRVLGIARVLHGFSARLHSHPADETYYILYGEGELRVGHEIKRVYPGSRVHIPAGVPHAMTPISKSVVLLFDFPSTGPFDSIPYTFHDQSIPTPEYRPIFHTPAKDNRPLLRTSCL
jgi:uncharacterized cupin superfamily protein